MANHTDRLRPTPQVSGEQKTEKAAPESKVDTARGDSSQFASTAAFVPTPETQRPANRKGPWPSVPGYEILGELGRGGMGVVYRAKQQGLDRVVAIKMLLAAEHADEELLTRFQTEAQAVATLQHPNIVQIYEIGQHNGLPFFSLEFVPGGSLAQKIGREPQPADESAAVVETLARAMHVAHQHNIVHRDLKPGNVLLAFADHSSGSSIHLDSSGHKLSAEGPLRAAIPKISDFGLAKRLAIDSQQTRSGQIMGSPSYMAPEQARGDVRQVGPLADVYALGAILYEMLTGRPPFLAGNMVETIQQVVHLEPIPPSRLALRIPRDLETICLKCLQKDPRKRYGSAEAMSEDLRRFQAGEPIVARPVGSAERFWRWCRRNKKLAFSSAAAVILLIFAAGESSWTAWKLSQKNQQIEAEKQTAQANEKIASEQATQAVRTIQLLVNKIQQRLSNAPETQEIRKEILNLASEQLKGVADKVDSSTSKEATQLAIHQSLGDLFVQLGEMTKALDQYQRAETIARERLIVRNYSDSSRTNLAMILRQLGYVTQEANRDMRSAKKYYEEALQIRQSILDRPFPGDGGVAAIPEVVRYELSEDHMRVGVAIYKLGDPAAAMPHWQQGLELRLALRDVLPKLTGLSDFDRGRMGSLPLDIARSKLSVGELSFRLRDPATALAIYAEVASTYDKYLQQNPDVTGLKHETAGVQGNYGDIMLFVEGPDSALPLYERSRALLHQLAEYDAYDSNFQRKLAQADYRLGNCALRAKDAEKAAEHFRESLKIRERLVAMDKSNDRRQMELMLSLAHCGEHVRAADMARKFRDRDHPDNELLIDVARCLAQCSVAAADDARLRSGYAGDANTVLQMALANGYKDAVFLEVEPDFDSLRETSAFRLHLKSLEGQSTPAEPSLEPVPGA